MPPSPFLPPLFLVFKEPFPSFPAFYPSYTYSILHTWTPSHSGTSVARARQVCRRWCTLMKRGLTMQTSSCPTSGSPWRRASHTLFRASFSLRPKLLFTLIMMLWLSSLQPVQAAYGNPPCTTSQTGECGDNCQHKCTNGE